MTGTGAIPPGTPHLLHFSEPYKQGCRDHLNARPDPVQGPDRER